MKPFTKILILLISCNSQKSRDKQVNYAEDESYKYENWVCVK